MLKREEIILEILKTKKKAGIFEIIKELDQKLEKKVSKISVNRDLDDLIQKKYIVRKGKARASYYELSEEFELLYDVDVVKYFKEDLDKRKVKEVFDFNVFNLLGNVEIFDMVERNYLNGFNDEYRINIKKLPQSILKKEYERLMIELSWKSSKIEGNTYDLLETEFLIKENTEAKGHTKIEALMILNHKKAFDYIYANKTDFKKIDKEAIKKIHYILTKDMDISKEIRNKKVGITGTKYIPLSASGEIEKALSLLCDLVNKQDEIFSKALLLNLIISYIQPFDDGNKRTGRLMGNAVLAADDYCPLSFRSVDELEYKKAILLFYEQNNISYFKKLFKEQYIFAAENYFKL